MSAVEYVRADLTQLKELLNVFAEVFDDPRTYLEAPPSDTYLESLLASDDFAALAAVADGEVVGGLAAYVLKKFERERSEIYIYDLGVRERYRRRKIATGLINKLREIAREIDAYVIYVQADQGDDPAIGLYESLGTREEVLHFDIYCRDEQKRLHRNGRHGVAVHADQSHRRRRTARVRFPSAARGGAKIHQPRG